MNLVANIVTNLVINIATNLGKASKKITKRTITSERKHVFACDSKLWIESVRKQVTSRK